MHFQYGLQVAIALNGKSEEVIAHLQEAKFKRALAPYKQLQTTAIEITDWDAEQVYLRMWVSCTGALTQLAAQALANAAPGMCVLVNVSGTGTDAHAQALEAVAALFKTDTGDIYSEKGNITGLLYPSTVSELLAISALCTAPE